jgi:iron(III) transport system permease protein
VTTLSTRPVERRPVSAIGQRWRTFAGPNQVGPAVILLIVCALVLIPVGYLVYGSLSSGGPGAPGNVITGQNWADAFNATGRSYLLHSVILGALSAVVAIILGTVFAWLSARCSFPGRRAFSTLILLPLLFSPLLSVPAWIGLADPSSGFLNLIGHRILGSAWPTLDIYSLWGMVLVLSMHFTPYVYLATRPVIAALDQGLEDAGSVLGAGLPRLGRTVVLPLVAPAVLASGILVFVLSAEEFNVAGLLGVNAHFLTIPYGVYGAFSGFPPNAGDAAALGLVLTIVTLAGMLLYLWLIRRSARYVTISGKATAHTLRRLGRGGATGAVVLILLYLVVSVFLPYAMLLLGSFSKYFTIKHFSWSLLTLGNYRTIFESGGFVTALEHTALLAILAATVVTILAVACAWVSVRRRGVFGFLMDRVAVLPVMIPSIAFGVGLLWAYIYLPGGLYGTTAVLFIAYVTRFLGHGVRISTSGLVQISADLEDAARMLGRSRMRAFISAALPLLRETMGSVWILIAIFSALEIPASIFLYTGSNMPASVLVYLTMQDGVITQAFAMGTVLATGVLVLCIIAQWRFKLFRHL